MANRTAKDAKSIKGTNPQYLVEKIIRTRIYDCKYWKEECFGLTAELLVDCAMELDHVGGVYGGNVQPTPFICLILKMLQIQPTKDIIIEFIKNPDYKYVRVLGALYLRLVGETMECYNYLEPLYNDYRKLKRKNRNGEFELIHVDEFIDELLHDDRVCDIILPRIQKRYLLEQNEQLEPRVSALDEDLSDVESEEEDEGEGAESTHRRRHSPIPAHRHRHDRDRERRHRSRSKSPNHRRRSRSPRGQRRSPHDDRERRRGRSRSRSYSPRRHHSPSRSHNRRERKRSRSKSRSPPPSHHHRHRHSSDTKDRKSEKTTRSEKSKEKTSSSKSESKKDSKAKKVTTSSGKELTAAEQEEIRQQNELRAKLGIKPLRV